MLDRILLIIPLWIVLDLYFFRVLQSALSGFDRHVRRGIGWVYWIYDAGLILALLYLKLTGSGIFSSFFFSLVGPILLSLLPKLLILPFLLVADIARLGSRLARPKETVPPREDRRKFINQALTGLSAVPFGYVLFGITKGAYHYKVYRNTLYFKDLPEEFDGLTITQLSDLHCGSFKDLDAARGGIELANAQRSDILALTGDLVNNLAAELEPWKGILSSLEAPLGVYSVLGNHDYGDYMDWNAEAEKEANFEAIKTFQREMGFRLLLDERVKLEKNGQHINLVGVQNWGKRFHQYGDLDKALAEVSDTDFSILLSHDPSHWEARVLSHPKPVQLTLSGHTHGMQFGISIPGLKWSPAKYMYRQWAGIYRKGPRYINVNRGFGFLGFSGRIGMWPEITVITLKKGPADLS